MDYSRKIAERLWNMPDRGKPESRREETFIDDIIQKNHIEKELPVLSELNTGTMVMQLKQLKHIRSIFLNIIMSLK